MPIKRQQNKTLLNSKDRAKETFKFAISADEAFKNTTPVKENHFYSVSKDLGLCILCLVPYRAELADRILPLLGNVNAFSGDRFNIAMLGYVTDTRPAGVQTNSDWKLIEGPNGKRWYFSDSLFAQQTAYLRNYMQFNYCGGVTAILFDVNRGQINGHTIWGILEENLCRLDQVIILKNDYFKKVKASSSIEEFFQAINLCVEKLIKKGTGSITAGISDHFLGKNLLNIKLPIKLIGDGELMAAAITPITNFLDAAAFRVQDCSLSQKQSRKSD